MTRITGALEEGCPSCRECGPACRAASNLAPGDCRGRRSRREAWMPAGPLHLSCRHMSCGLNNRNPLPTALEPGSPRSSLFLGAD